MKQLFRILLAATTIAAMAWACKKTQPEQPKPQPEPKKDTTFVLEAVVTGEANFDGTGEISYTVKSIKKIKEKEEFMPWTMEFSTDGGQSWTTEKPEFVTLITKEENGDLTAKAYTATFTAQEKTLQTSDIILKAKPVLSNVDLSTVDIHGEKLAAGQSTANCYVIHNPGTYRFPTIYGNAKKNGQNNESAYKTDKSGNNILKTFLGAKGEITKPEIDGIANACLIWQDTKDLISDIKFADNYVSFAVKKETIHNGNAIIAVRDNDGTILWSWHIWVTERDLHPVEVENFQNEKYNFMPVNLGWCGFGNEWYAPREVKARLKQEGGKTVDLTFNQKQEVLANDYDIKNGNSPYYQWGRKDPMLPGDGITAGNGKDKECFTTEDQYQFAYKEHGEELNTDDIKEYIRNPHKFNIKKEMDGVYYNLWNVNNETTELNDEVVIKTVYDPSPVGYSLPAPNAFTGFTTTGQNSNNASELNVEGDFDKGWLFYSKANKTGSTMFFPAGGFRNNTSGALNYVSGFGYTQAAGPNSTSRGRALNLYSGRVSPLGYNNRSYGFAVRCAEEK
ncbi:MAG: hypothetical protein ACTTGX_01370 [Candidatus Cryptobacteroides sp.]